MRMNILWACALSVFAVATASAQTKFPSSGICSKPDVQQSIPAGDQEGHIFGIAQGKCVTIGDVGGVQSKEGMYSEHRDISANHTNAWGVYVETYENGDKIFYSYQSSSSVKDGAPPNGENKYEMTGGTGKMKGITGSGICKIAGKSDGGLDYSCTGEYTLAGAASAKK